MRSTRFVYSHLTLADIWSDLSPPNNHAFLENTASKFISTFTITLFAELSRLVSESASCFSPQHRSYIIFLFLLLLYIFLTLPQTPALAILPCSFSGSSGSSSCVSILSRSSPISSRIYMFILALISGGLISPFGFVLFPFSPSSVSAIC